MSLFSSDKSKSSGRKEKPAGKSPTKSLSKSASSNTGESKKRARKGNSQKSAPKKKTTLDDVSSVCVLDVTLVF